MVGRNIYFKLQITLLDVIKFYVLHAFHRLIVISVLTRFFTWANPMYVCKNN